MKTWQLQGNKPVAFVLQSSVVSVAIKAPSHAMLIFLSTCVLSAPALVELSEPTNFFSAFKHALKNAKVTTKICLSTYEVLHEPYCLSLFSFKNLPVKVR